MTQLREVARPLAIACLVIGAIGLAVMVGYAVPQQPMLVVAGIVVLLVGVVALSQPVALPLLAMPVIVVVARFGVGPVDMTISDWMLGLAFWPAVILGRRPFSPELRQILWGNAIYQATTLFTLIANPFVANYVEWFHAWLLISGALIVGWAAGRAGHARLALKLFVCICVVLAAATVVQGLLQYATGDLSPVYPQYPWPMHKNFIGTVLLTAAIICYSRVRWLGLSQSIAVGSFWVLLAAIAMSQSRQALLGLVVGLLIVALRQHEERSRALIALIAAAPMVWFVSTLVRDQIAEGNEHNSLFQRIEWYQESVTLWLERPLTGHGLRYWTQPDAPSVFQPPNVFLEILASAGLLGLVGFVVMTVLTLLALLRLPRIYGTLAVAVVMIRLVQAQLDVFWVSPSVSIPFLITGVLIGASMHAGAKSAPMASSGTTSRLTA